MYSTCTCRRFKAEAGTSIVINLGSRDDAVVRALAFHQCFSGSNPRPIPGCYKLVEFVVGSCLAPRGFLQVLVFPTSTKSNTSTL